MYSPASLALVLNIVPYNWLPFQVDYEKLTNGGREMMLGSFTSCHATTTTTTTTTIIMILMTNITKSTHKATVAKWLAWRI